ncbi:Remorin, C-terminal protein [Actinidia chinensis var. chinensis]|uniref:Remorin, C-terminal protein n=1 Tax=Actinidia chinensis var. chinensis TaxID=1590841 RepID=A0A2R6Q033_ACTCC|nr:Remorin, C-terminal protein [Actinidia chinensis var. chinensis]
MPELGFEHQNQQRPGFRTRDVSPDSILFTIFSSASGSVDRCSFASDVHDHDSFASEASQFLILKFVDFEEFKNFHLNQHLAGRDLRETSSGPDSDPKKSTVHRNSRLARKVQKIKVHKEDSYENETLGFARNSFSQALKECQDGISRSEVVLKKPNRQRPASLDLNNHVTNVTTSSPRFGVTKKSSAMTQQPGTFPSPGTPNHRHASVGIQKGWSSERVPLHNNANLRHGSATLLPFNNGRTLPSKWEDAERWIFSPVTGDGIVKPSFQPPQRRPKSNSGSLGPPGIAYYSLHSPVLPMVEGGNVGNLMVASPFLAGVIAADSFSIRSGLSSGGAGIFPPCIEPCMTRSVSVHGCSGLLKQSSLPDHQDKELDGDKDAASNISRAVSRRDMATQMSPDGSPHSSPGRRPSLSPSTPSVLPIVEFKSVQSSKFEVRDVQVDERVTVTRWSKKHRAQFSGKGSENVNNWKKKALEVRSSVWEVSEAAKSISKMKREEAKISAWENLQRAKSEAAIRKLEMKLEKRRSSSMDKIMNKLRSAQKKAQELRSSVLTNQSRQVARTSNKVISFQRTRQMSSLSGCFTCHAY